MPMSHFFISGFGGSAFVFAVALLQFAPFISSVDLNAAFTNPFLERGRLVNSTPLRQKYSTRSSFFPTPTTKFALDAQGIEDHSTSLPLAIERKYYEHDGYKISYLHKPASPGHESDPPLVLVHPVGIGISSWFWTKFLEEWVGGEAYAPDMIGCGLENGSFPWNPDTKGMSFPLGWVNALEKLIQTEVASPDSGNGWTRQGFLSWPKAPRSCVVVAQGGMTPVAVLLAARNPCSTGNVQVVGVSHLVLTSPQTWEDMVVPVPQFELANNYDFLRSQVLGKLAFSLLESRWAVRFFSDLFLFSGKCDEDWVDLTTRSEATQPEARQPIMAFNAGLLNHRSYEEELRTLEQPTLVMSGLGDKRVEDRLQYREEMRSCGLESIRGTNVMPWESPTELCAAISAFLKREHYEVNF
uniref:AB hydrolase-1 domain-containing protein n=1 Tax=Odontella aurita TaxID=265563 RepID=A0A7S4IK79_9STRA|mmetsp:Transcript_26351/g.77925  ORF Transcript_26351/g.77925 Transcript_26351/m.77925 type:complete len:412 (+) Transcript_26351:196-1431(+)